MTFGFWMTVGDDPRPRCRARITTAAVHMGEHTKLTVPAAWRERFAEFALDEAQFPSAR